MSARALLNDLRVIELPMTYSERIGTSKLSVLGDGMRFLRAIVSGVLCYRPEKIFLLGLVLCMSMAVLLGAYPTEFYLKNGLVEEWMIYRFMACFLLGAFGLTLLLATALTNQMAYLGTRRAEADRFWSSLCATRPWTPCGFGSSDRVAPGWCVHSSLARDRRICHNRTRESALVAPADRRIRVVQRGSHPGVWRPVQGCRDLEESTPRPRIAGGLRAC